ncbi:MAG: SUMF1/EgtB/PvdO family nonheme iron enzyme [Bacteroidota bacterium]|nr:SUMF1/EgtB/PvdO family nonheme iron enzyme [Bacteroidota bacterium]
MTRVYSLFYILLLSLNPVLSQELKDIAVNSDSGLRVQYLLGDEQVVLDQSQALFSFLLGENMISSLEFYKDVRRDSVWYSYNKLLEVYWELVPDYCHGFKARLRIRNISQDTLEIHNLVPFGESPDRVYITGLGRHGLSRTHLFRPGLLPVNVIIPDNAWNLGFAEMEFEEFNVFALMRRGSSEKASIRRFENILYPDGWVEYDFFADIYYGVWQEGLRVAFQDRWLYDLEEFDQTLYERPDLKWIRHSYASHLLYGWDHQFYDSERLEITLDKFILRGQKWYGGDDFIGIWPTWPTLGLDQRNQWDLFRDLPGGLAKMHVLANLTRDLGSRFFICYNPWDSDTRSESHFGGMAELIEAIGADGVVLDTQGSSSKELQESADSVREGVIMYSEGMAVPRDMPGIVSGRVHNALYYPPMLNLNKLIKPDFAIFRVAELAFERIRREYATSFFNGYGTELNIFKPGRPDWIEEDYRFFGQTLRILRENTDCFVDFRFTPLIPTTTDNIWVNQWPGDNKTIYTVFSLIPEGFDDMLFEAEEKPGYHWVDLWSHSEITLKENDGRKFVPVSTDAFHKSWLGTNNEGAVTAIAHLPELIVINQFGDRVNFYATKGDLLRIWAGQPDYEKQALEYGPNMNSFNFIEKFGRYEGDIVFQLFGEGQLLDERIVTVKPGTPRLISIKEETVKDSQTPDGMVRVPSGVFSWNTTHGDEFIGYPANPYRASIQISGFFLDKHPVTNQEFYQFIRETGYWPSDPVNYLRHWKKGKPLRTDRNKPVIFVSYEDAKAYSVWAGKRLPTELEWQYAAQTEDHRPWPWSREDTIQREKEFVTNTLTVSRLKGVGSVYCNPGNGMLDDVEIYPKGMNPFGLYDLVGSVWQMTQDMYDNGSNTFIILKGGSYFNPGSSWWYVQGGPRPLHYRQMLLRVSRGFERNATVGFRCLRDAQN